MSQKLRNVLFVYLAINSLYILPCSIWFNQSRGDPSYVPRLVLAIYVSSMIIFYFLRLTYAHILLCAVFIPLSIRQFTRDKKKVLFIFSLLIAAVDIAANIFWEKTARWVVRQ